VLPLTGLLLLAMFNSAAWSQNKSNVPASYDLIIRGGTLYDGSGTQPAVGDVAIGNDRIVAVGQLPNAKGRAEIDATGLAVAPGFINMLSWANESLLADGRSQSDIRQGVTLEVFGEGWSMGPLSPAMRADMIRTQGDIKYEVPWTTLAEYLDHLVARGVSPNVASFVGATTIRVHVLGYEDRRPRPAELSAMRQLVRREMEAGALGIGSSLIYAPAHYAGTDELIELCKVAAEYGGVYISHIRSEGNRLVESVDELLRIAREAKIAAEIYHLKAAGRENWPKQDEVIRRIEQARAAGLKITADMYPYTAGATGLDAAMPPWVQEGGLQRWIERLRDPKVRERVAREMRTRTDEWENLLLAAGRPENVLLVGFDNKDLRHLTGKTLAEVAARRGQSVEETAMDLVIEDGSRVGTVYFFMHEEGVRQKIKLPWCSFGSDAASVANEGLFLNVQPHPRAYGCFARVLRKYVREEQLIPLEEAVRKMTSLPAETLGLDHRGRLAPEFFADIVVFDPKTIQDHATFEQPHQYATGVKHVLVNGQLVLKDGEHTGATPGRVVRRKKKA
jgi:N-acyl-D-amino-acid deacylase